MALLPWRLQGDIAKGEVDPLVTVFVGAERAVMDDDGNPTAATFIAQDTKDPVVMKLSEAVAALVDATKMDQARRDAKAKTTPTT